MADIAKDRKQQGVRKKRTVWVGGGGCGCGHVHVHKDVVDVSGE